MPVRSTNSVRGAYVLQQGVVARTRKVVWNRNDNRVKLICLCKKSDPVDCKFPLVPETGTITGEGNGAGLQAATEAAK
jgi:hypothetical protein